MASPRRLVHPGRLLPLAVFVGVQHAGPLVRTISTMDRGTGTLLVLPSCRARLPRRAVSKVCPTPRFAQSFSQLFGKIQNSLNKYLYKYSNGFAGRNPSACTIPSLVSHAQPVKPVSFNHCSNSPTAM